jgi:PAS domain-containing protein
MGKKSKRETSDNPLEVHEELDKLARLLAAFSHVSAIELAVCDNQLRIRAVNDASAAVHGLPVEAFVGNTFGDVIGDAAPEVEANFRRVLNPVTEFGSLR